MIENIKHYMFCSGHSCFDQGDFNNSLANDVLHVSYKGLSMEQNSNIIEPFWNLIKNSQPSRVIEIGTFHGALTLLIRDILYFNFNNTSSIHTYDINHPSFTIEKLIDNNIKINTMNLFSNDYTLLENETIKELISSDGTTILICDGGCKRCEFNLLSPYLKTGDIIMAHDYAPSSEYFEQFMRYKKWNWCEIQDSDINESCQKYNLKPYMREEFLDVAWACFKKEL